MILLQLSFVMIFVSICAIWWKQQRLELRIARLEALQLLRKTRGL